MLNIMQTKPLRNYGIDVTQTSYKPLMEELGIDKSVSELTQAEKEILRYISTLRQAKNAMGDFANTIESPANQLKVLKQQFYEMQAAIGNLFVGAFARILPYVNGIIMVIKALARAIASFFGIQMKDYNTGLASYADDLNDYSDSLDGVGDSANGAGNSIKALKRQVLAFDQINNLTTPTPSSGSGGSGGGGSLGEIDEKLLAALEEYDNGMDKVRMKAVEIRDTIMEWLGFTKQVDDETGEVSFSYDTVGKKIDQIAKEIATNLGNMLNYYTNQIDWSKMGEYLALGLNTVFGFIDTFIQTYDWRNLGNKIAEFINKAIKDIDAETIGRILTDKMRVAILSLTGFIEKFDFKEFGSKLATAINSAIKNIPVEELVTGLNKLVDGIWDAIKELVKKIDWGSLIDTAITSFTGLDWDTKLLVLAPVIASALGTLFGSQIIQDIISQAIIKAIIKGLTEGGISINGANLAGAAGTTAGVVVGTYGAAETYKGSKKAAKKATSGEKITMSDLFGFEKPESIKDWLKMGLISANLGSSVTGMGVGSVATGAGIIPEIKTSIMENGFLETMSNINKSIEETFGIDLYATYLQPWVDGFEGVKTWFTEGFDGIYTFITDTWDNVKTTTEEIWTGITSWIDENVVTPIKEFFDPLKKWFEELWGSISKTAEDIWNNITGFAAGCAETVQILWDLAKKWIEEHIIEPIKTKFGELWDTVKIKASEAWNKVTEIWGKITGWVKEKIVDPVKTKFTEIWDNIKTGASKAWEGIKNVFSPVVTWFKDTFSRAWSKVKDVFSTGGKIFSGIKEGIESTFKTVVNGIIGGINKIISKPFNAINSAIGKLKSISIAGAKPFENKLSYISVPQIPQFANGGFPEDGFFRANHSELVGKFSNGKTAVANNQQIIKGIKEGVYEAVSAAMSEGGMGSVQIDLHTDEGVVVDRINRITRQTGNCPIEI